MWVFDYELYECLLKAGVRKDVLEKLEQDEVSRLLSAICCHLYQYMYTLAEYFVVCSLYFIAKFILTKTSDSRLYVYYEMSRQMIVYGLDEQP